jgi:hypothetical protein
MAGLCHKRLLKLAIFSSRTEIEICHRYDNRLMKAKKLSDPVVRAVVAAMRDGDRNTFFAAFAPSAVLTDDGNPQPLEEWADREIFRAHGRLEVHKQDRGGLELVGPFRSDQWDMETIWRFDVADGRVRRLDVAAL